MKGMLKDITSISLSGANFDNITSIDFFDPHEGNKTKYVKGALLYGRNGTGKSSIARAFRKLTGESIPVIHTASLNDDTGRIVTLSEDDKKHIFVFDEDYVDQKVRFKEDHLDTIVMLGPMADLAEKTEQATKEMNAVKAALDKQKAIVDEYCDINNPKSPKNCIVLLANALRGDDNWAGRDKEINHARQNTGVRDDTYKRFITLTPQKAKTELIIDYKQKLKELEDARSGASTIDSVVPTLQKSYMTYDDKTIQSLLGEEIEKPELSEREKKLFAIMNKEGSSTLSDRLNYLSTEGIHECPYCYQMISDEYKEGLIASIEKVLNKLVEDHEKKLQTCIGSEITIDLSNYSKLPGFQKCVDLINEINNYIVKNNEYIDNKRKNPYNPIRVELSNVRGRCILLEKSLNSLEEERKEYNKAVKKTAPIISTLHRINAEIAYYDVIDLSVRFDAQQKKCESEKKLYDRLYSDYVEKNKAVEDLEAQRKNIKLAIDGMNACMKYIFFSEDRLRIEFIDGEYKLLSRGKSVKPCDVSVGERNIIGLCYFFISILEGKEERKAYDDEYMLIIDDPISSYDNENRIGILSFLKYKLSVFLESNRDTKALVMTHDLVSFYDIHKIFEEIVDACKQKGYQIPPKFNRFELKDNMVVPFSYNKRQEYTELMKNIYDYATGHTQQHELIIGNMMRQVLEAFSTFEYKKSIEAVSTDSMILNMLPEPEYVTYYNNLMYRLVLHGGSHREEHVKAMKDYHFFSLISEIEKQRTARDILCFIYLLNKRHLLEHLKECGNDVEERLKTWCQDIKMRAVNC